MSEPWVGTVGYIRLHFINLALGCSLLGYPDIIHEMLRHLIRRCCFNSVSLRLMNHRKPAVIFYKFFNH